MKISIITIGEITDVNIVVNTIESNDSTRLDVNRYTILNNISISIEYFEYINIGTIFNTRISNILNAIITINNASIFAIQIMYLGVYDINNESKLLQFIIKDITIVEIMILLNI